MWNIIKNNIIRYITDKRKIIPIVVFAFFCGGQIKIGAAAGMSLCEYMLFVLTDHYYVIYFMLMTYLFFSFDSMREENYLVKIRIKKIKNNYVCRVISTFIQSAFFIMAHVVVAYIVGINAFHYTNYFTSVLPDDYYNDTLAFFFEYQKCVKSPVGALFMAMIFMIMGFVFVSMIGYIVHNVVGKKGMLAFMAIMLLDIMIGFKVGTHGMGEAFFLNHYFLLHHVLFQSGKLYAVMNLVIEILFLIMGYYIIRKYNAKKKKNVSYIFELQRDVYKYSGFFLVAYIAFNLISVWTVERKITEIDVGLANLAGYSAQSFNFMEFVKYLLFFLIPIFFVGSMKEKEKNLFHSQVAIRYGNQKRWNNMIEKHIDRYIFKYVLFFEGMILGCMLLLKYLNKTVSKYGLAFAEYLNVKWTDLYVILGMALFIKLIEVFYYKNIFCLWATVTKNNIAAYIITFLGFGIGQLLKDKWFISYGASAVYHLAEVFREKGMCGIVISILFMIGKMVMVNVADKLWKESGR